MKAPARLLLATGAPRLWAWLVLWLWLTAGWAETPPLLVVYIEGVEGELRENVAAFLEIRQLVGEPVTDPSLINSSPYSDGWFYEIEPSNWLRETQILLMADKYSEWIKGEFHRLRDFLSGILKPEAPGYSYVTLQDGGEIADHVLSSLGPEAWEEFQIRFIDSANQ